MEKFTCHQIINSINDNDLEEFKKLLNQEDVLKEIGKRNNFIINKIISSGSVNFLIPCIPHLDKVVFQGLFESYTRYKNLDVVKKLLEHGTPNKTNSCLINASVADDVEMVKLLIPYTNVKLNNSAALMIAIQRKNNEMVKLLVPHSNLKFSSSLPLQKAVISNNIEMIDLLWDKSSVEHAFKVLNNSYHHKEEPDEGMAYFYNRYEAEKSKNSLVENIKKDTVINSTPKKRKL